MKVKAKISATNMLIPWDKRENKDIGVVVFDMKELFPLDEGIHIFVTVTILEEIHEKKRNEELQEPLKNKNRRDKNRT